MSLARREFFAASAAAIAAVGGGRLFGAPQPASRAAAVQRPAFHSRHIPIEHLNLDTPMGRDVVRNGLCDTIKPDVLKRLRDLGVELIEMRVVWWEFEPAPGRFDWSRTLRDMDAVLAAGLKVGLFAWIQYPPVWYDPRGESHARYRGLLANEDATVVSLWDPQTLQGYDRLLEIISEKLRGRLSFVYNAITGVYGEYGIALGPKHYKFSSPTRSGDYLTGDRCARASFAQSLRERYGSPEALGRAWGLGVRSFDDDLMPRLPFAQNPLRQREDYSRWTIGSLDEFADRVCTLYRRHFPGLPGALPIGCPREPTSWAMVKSHAARLAAKHGLTARWTGCAHLKSFDRSHLLARRLSSAAHFYGAPFGTEAALIIDSDNAANALYESLANAAAIVHDDPQNIFRTLAVHRALRPKLLVDPPVCSLAVFYPSETEMLQTANFAWDAFVDRSAALRRVTDYDICDSTMIADGYLAGKRDLLLLTKADVPEETARAMVEFAKRARVWLYGDADAAVLHGTTTLAEMAARAGAAGLVRFNDWHEPVAHAAPGEFRIPAGGQPCYRTRHQHHESCYFPERQTFEILERAADSSRRLDP